MATTTLNPHPAANRAWHTLEIVRWAPAPHWEGGPAARTRYAAYLVGSMAAWIAIGFGISAALGGLTGLAG